MPLDLSDTELDTLWSWHLRGLTLPAPCSARDTDQGPEICIRRRLSLRHSLQNECWLKHNAIMNGRYWQRI